MIVVACPDCYEPLVNERDPQYVQRLDLNVNRLICINSWCPREQVAVEMDV